MVILGQSFLIRTRPDGTREISWRAKVLIWLVPVLFIGAGALLALAEFARYSGGVPTTGTVVQVYEWDSSDPFSVDGKTYGPVYEYINENGVAAQASVGMSHGAWNFEVGSQHPVRYFPGENGNIRLDGFHNWLIALIVAAIGGAVLPFSILVWWLAKRWLRKGTAG